MAYQTPVGEKRQITLSEAVKDFCSYTSAHGLGLVATASSRKARLMWICLFLIGFGACLHDTVKLVSRYYRYEVKVDVLTVRDESVLFPAITICNLNRFRKSKIRDTRFENIAVSIYMQCSL